ncbi:tetratricopeptide repeat protein [Bordetella genomosp. 11]|nr:tetratricopeptide repeat protein [Bordetella genomosp. 11]
MTIKTRLLPALLATVLLWLPISAAQAQGMPGGMSGPGRNSNATTLDEPPPEGGWDALARLLEAAKPGVDTRLQPTPSQITDKIEQLITAGRNEQALAMIEKRLADTANPPPPGGTDVQLEFQHARVLAALGREQEALDIYEHMTSRYPELPEPWNNMAVIYAKRGEIDRAETALRSALVADPNYAAARANMADVQLLQAKRSYGEAAKLGVTGSGNKARAVDNLLKEPTKQ